MPVLVHEPNLYPEDLFESLELTTAAELPDHRWWVLHIRPRQEKCLARELFRAQVPFYLPLVSRFWRSRGQLMTSHLPLFPGYVFLRADAEGRLLALKTNRVVQSLEVRDQERLWQDLRQINRLIASGAPVSPEDRLGPGTVVEICSGPLTGIKGTVLRGASGRRLVVQVDFIQRGASVVLDETTLVRVETPRLASRN